MENNFHDQIRKRLTEIFANFGVTPEINLAEEEGMLTVDIKTPIDNLFIERSSDPLLALQHLLRVILRSDFPEEELSISINMGGFKQHQRELLAVTTHEAAVKAKDTGQAVHLPPMSSYERRLVHLALSKETGIIGESEGEGSTRHVVIKSN